MSNKHRKCTRKYKENDNALKTSKITKTGFTHGISETINRLGRGISCVQSRAMRDYDKDCEAPSLKPSEIASSKVVKGSDTDKAVDCFSEK